MVDELENLNYKAYNLMEEYARNNKLKKILNGIYTYD